MGQEIGEKIVVAKRSQKEAPERLLESPRAPQGAHGEPDGSQKAQKWIPKVTPKRKLFEVLVQSS